MALSLNESLNVCSRMQISNVLGWNFYFLGQQPNVTAADSAVQRMKQQLTQVIGTFTFSDFAFRFPMNLEVKS
jgi:hypothetical protein